MTILTDGVFKYKTYRCEWQVQCGEVDQYGDNFKPYKTSSWPSRELALEEQEEIAYLNLFNHTWVPKDAPHSFCECILVYREVEVK